MRRLLYLIGVPGAGKSTLVAEALSERATCYEARSAPFAHQVYGLTALALGGERNGFAGTDVLHMAVQPDVTEFLWKHPEYTAVFGEGDRLGNGRFFDWALKAGFELTVAWLDVPPEVAAARREQRAVRLGVPEQDPTWVKGRATKVHNITMAYGRQLWRLDGRRPFSELVAELQGHPVIRVLLDGADPQAFPLWGGDGPGHVVTSDAPAPTPYLPAAPVSVAPERAAGSADFNDPPAPCLPAQPEPDWPSETIGPEGSLDEGGRLATCALCGGEGEVNGVPCPGCDGEGWRPRDSTDRAQASLFDLGPLTVADPEARVRAEWNSVQPVTPAARMEVFRSALIKGLKFAYQHDTYRRVVADLDAVKRETGADNFSHVLLLLLDHWKASHTGRDAQLAEAMPAALRQPSRPSEPEGT